jgi:hypothetical protein
MYHGRAAVLAASCVCAAPMSAQQIAARPAGTVSAPDSAEVVASEAYLAGGFHRFLFGGHYRRVWAAPIRVPVLDLRSYAGGLTPSERGGGAQTQSLRLHAADGREFRFRSLDKDPTQKLPKHLRTATIQRLVRDQTSALHPGGALAAAAFAEALGVPQPPPTLVVLPDDPALGEFRKDFGGMLGTLQLHPEEGKDGAPGFAGFRDVVDTDKLVPLLNASPDNRVDPREYLTARLLDLFLNDWDRHQGNWRWGTREAHAPRRWTAIPQDRDQVFAWYGGALLGVARLKDPRLVPFSDDFRLGGLTQNGAELDRRLLEELDHAAWDSVAHAVQSRLSDSVIAAALGRMPAPYRELTGAEITAKLRHRRERLPQAALSYYGQLARVVDVHGTDEAECLRVHHAADGRVMVTLERRSSKRPAHYRRTFTPAETREVRVYLHGGDDTVAVSGGGNARITVRAIAGKGADTLPASNRGLRSYLKPGDSAWHPDDSMVNAALDRRPWPGKGATREPPPTDRGRRLVPGFRTGYTSGLGLTVRAEAALVAHGFRAEPYRSRAFGGLSHATAVGAWRADVGAELVREASPMFGAITASASGLERPWFFGFGNTSAVTAPLDAYRTAHRQYRLNLVIGGRGPAWTVGGGPFLRHTRTDPPTLAVPPYGRGSGEHTDVGVAAGIELDTRDHPANPRGGVRLRADAALVPAVWDAPGTSGSVRASASTYLAPALPLAPVLALRAGAARSFGSYPWFDAASVGGESSLRGFDAGRYSGDGAVFAGAELRARLFRFSLGVPGDLGLLAGTDVGRVWLDGERSGRWHASAAGGIWVSIIDRAATISATLADGERTMLYLRGGFAY